MELKKSHFCGWMLMLALLISGPAAAQEPVFNRTLAFATKTGFRAVFAWEAKQPVMGVVHYGTSPDALTQSISPVAGEPDTAQMAVAQVQTGATYYYQVEDTLTGQRSAIGSFRALNAYNDWNGSAYELDLLVQLDLQSLPPDIPADQALEDIAAGINVFAERLYDALDGYARLGRVLITDTILDYPVNPPANAPVCDPQRSSLADVLIQTTVPFDSHTYGGWSISNPCISFYVGRLGQLVVPWEDDLHFGYISTHEMLHYAFNAPDLYPLPTTDSDCNNPEWDGSIMHNSGEYAEGRWQLTELDRNPTLTPCNHGTAPYSWDALRERYTEVPLNPDGPIDHMFDDLPRGNADGGALEIWILDREPGASSLTVYTPDDQVVRCDNDLPQIDDPEGDATGLHVVAGTPAPTEPSLDVKRGWLTWDAAAESLTFHIEVADIEATPPAGGTGHFFRFYFDYAGTRYQVRASNALAQSFSLALEDNTTIATALPGRFDFAGDEVTVTLSANRFAQAVPGAPRFAAAAEISGLEILAQRHIAAVTLTADTGTGVCTYRIGQETLPPNRPPIAAGDAATVSEDGSVDIAVLPNDSDPDGDAVSLDSFSQAGKGKVSRNTDGTLRYLPNADFHGADSFRYTIADGKGGSGTATVQVTVTPAPDAPVAGDDSASVTGRTPVTVAVLDNDSDADGEPLAVVAVTQGAQGRVTHDGTAVTYTPSGPTGSDTFTYTVSDGQGGTDTATVTVLRTECFTSFADDLEPAPEAGWTFNNANTGLLAATTWAQVVDPLASSPAHSFYSDATDASPDKDDRLVAPGVNATSNTRLSFRHRFATEVNYDGGVLEVSTDGGATWRDVVAAGGRFLAGGYNGTLSALSSRPGWTGVSGPTMTEVSVDLGALAGPLLVRWRLKTDANAGNLGWWIDDVAFTNLLGTTCTGPSNSAPAALDDAATTQVGAALTVDALANDTDPDGDPLRITAVGQPAHGTVSTDGARVTYTPSPSYTGTDVFSYTASDSWGGSDAAQVTVRVNARPAAQDDAASANEDQASTIEVLANDRDPNGDTLQVTAVGRPSHGSASINADGSISYVPAANFHGADSFTYTADDGNGGSDDATVSVEVRPVNDAPSAADDSATTRRNHTVRIAVRANDTDVDGDALTIGSVTPAPNGTVSIRNDGTVSYRPRPNFTGTDSFTYTVRDGNGGAATATVTVTVTD